MKSNFKERLDRVYASVKGKLEGWIESGEIKRPIIGMILGSGLGNYVSRFGSRDESVTNDKSAMAKEIPFGEIDGFPVTTVEGHKGIYKFSGNVLVQAGRFHYYEGRSMDDIVLPIFLQWKMGVRVLIITNASGGINLNYKPGEFVLIKDHINLLGANPLVGLNIEDFGPRFPDMSEAYSKGLRELVKDVTGGTIKEGVYAAMLGPSYETPAEITMLKNIGADLVGMSTVPEVIVANYLGIKVLGISCVTNMAAGILDTPLSHEEVIEVTKRVEVEFSNLIEKIVDALKNRIDEYI